MPEYLKGYKAFEKGLICKGKQYAENTIFEEPEAVICEKGMHFCVDPFDVLDYYPLIDDNGDLSEFAEVEALTDSVTDDEKKYCTTKLKIGARLSLTGFVKACIDFAFEKTRSGERSDNTSNNSDGSKLASSGYGSKLASSGDEAKLASSGDWAKLASSGDWAKLASSGYGAQLASSGEKSVVCCAGRNSMAKAKKGSWITLSEWGYSEDKKHYVPKCVKTEYVDGERIKEDVFYKLENGEFVEVKTEE